ncbi:MAG: nucleoside hydrolase [Acidobacteriota bacterium]|nr:nucleoside hydrolase [Acidobacteriota bacterium]
MERHRSAIGFLSILPFSLAVFLVPGILFAVSGPVLPDGAAARTTARIPVILDTDIGDDIDDTWALVMLLKSPEFDLKLVTTTYGKAEYRAKIAAKILTVAGRTDVPVGLGAGGREGTGGQAAWVNDYELARYTGRVHQDGVQALIDVINASKRPVTVISIGPSTTVAEALTRAPGIVAKAFFVGMQGSVRKGYDGGAVGPEWNVKCDVPAARKALLAPWKRTTITPLDTCGLVRLKGERFVALAASSDTLVRALLENYRLWANKPSLGELRESSVLFDTVAVYLAFPATPCLSPLEKLAIAVADGGLTRIDPAGNEMFVATAWQDLNGYQDFLVKRLLQ